MLSLPSSADKAVANRWLPHWIHTKQAGNWVRNLSAYTNDACRGACLLCLTASPCSRHHGQPTLFSFSSATDPCEGKCLTNRLPPALAATSDCKTFPCRSSKTEADLNLAQARMRDLDAQLSAKEADLATALTENRNLENSLCELKANVATVRLVLEFQLCFCS